MGEGGFAGGGFQRGGPERAEGAEEGRGEAGVEWWRRISAGGWRRGVRRAQGRPEEKERTKERAVGLVPDAGTRTCCGTGNSRCALGRARRKS